MIDVVACLWKASEFPVDAPVGMENGGVISPTEELADLGETMVSVAAQEVHGDVSCVCDVARAGWTDELLDRDVEVAAHGLEDCVGLRFLLWTAKRIEGL